MALIGSIIGDIIGSRFEYPRWRPDDLDWEHCELFTNECEFTDDTILSIATKYALDNDIRFEDAYIKFAKKYPNKGYGDMFEHWIETGIMQQSYGNGSAMRVSPIIDYYSSNDVKKNSTLAITVNNSITCTHFHPESVKGAVTTALSGYMAERGETKEEIYRYVHSIYNDKDYAYPVSMTMDNLRETYQWSSTCQNTVPVAIRCFLDSTDYVSCIRNCLSLQCDMDTMCCIAGGIAEAFYGNTGFDNKIILQKYLDDFLYKCIEDIL